MMGSIKKSSYTGEGDGGYASFSNIAFHNQSYDVKGIVEGTTIKSRGGGGRGGPTEFVGTKIFISSMGQGKNYFHTHAHTNKTHRVARLIHGRKVADSIHPVQRITSDCTCAVPE